MQFKFLIAFALMGACLIQGISAQASHTNIQKGLIDDTINKAKEAIEKLTALIQQKINEALKTLNELKEKATEEMNHAIETVKQQLLEIIEKAKHAIDEIKKKAEQAGIDISNCITQNEDEFQKLFEKFLADEVQCVTKEIEEVMRIITEAVQMMTDAFNAVKELPKDLKDCITAEKPIICAFNVWAEAIKQGKNLPIQIAKKVQEVTTFVAELKARLEKCATIELANAGIAAAGIVGDVAKCAAEKGLEKINL